MIWLNCDKIAFRNSGFQAGEYPRGWDITGTEFDLSRVWTCSRRGVMPKGAVNGRRTALPITRPYSPVHSDRTAASIPSRAASSDWTPRPADVKWTFCTTRRRNPRLGYLGRRWKYGGGSWQAGSVDYENNQTFFGISNPNPDFRLLRGGLSGRECRCLVVCHV